MKLTLLALAGILVAGCASESSVTVGDPGQKGVVRSDIDRAQSAAQTASAKVHEGDKDLAGN